MRQPDSGKPSQDQPLRVRLRPDLQPSRQSYQGRDYWLVKDPVALKYYRFEEEEFALLQMLDGKSSAETIRQKFAERFAPQRISGAELFQFIGTLYRSSLLISDSSGQATTLVQRRTKGIHRQRRASMTNVLAVRLKGCDPDVFLGWLNRRVGWVFAWPCVVLAGILVLSAAALIFTHFDEFQSKLPTFGEIFAARNWCYLALTLMLTKVLHEFGHGLACKRFGSQCHNMGVMFLVLMPCLYCDVSDSWTVASKWKRAAIAAAGMYLELILAAICAFIWWFSLPGMVNLLALNVVLVCSVSTILFNANPLLRYDGYYILADLIEIPNLRQKASSCLRRFFGRVLLGLPVPADPFLPKRHQWLLVVYAVAAFIYRWAITFSIFWFLYTLLQPYGLKILGQMLALVAIFGLLGVPLIQLCRFFSVPGRLDAVKTSRIALVSVLAIIVLASCFLIPLPNHVRARFYVQSRDVANVYVEVPGAIDKILAEPQLKVVKGQPLLQLVNHDLVQEIENLTADAAIAWTRYHATLSRASVDDSAQQEVPLALASFEALNQLLQQRREDLEKLQVKSPATGEIVAAGHRPRASAASQTLSSWHGHALERRNANALLPSGTLVCQVVPDARQLEAILVIDQQDIEFVLPGNVVRLWVDQLRGQVPQTKIDSIATVELKSVPKSLSLRYGGALPTRTTENGIEAPMSATYQVRALIDNPAQEILPGATGVAKIRSGSRTVAQRVWRMACQTFRFEL